MKRLRAYLELARLSNLPTVWTGALVGIYAGYTAALASAGLPPAHVGFDLLLHVLNQGFVLIVALSCLYVSGMVLNDLFDAEVDRIERPHRPIPSGRVGPTAARRLAVALLVAGVFGLSLYNGSTVLLGILLALAVLAYNALHHRSPWAVILMGLCRSLVYFVAAAVVLPDVSVRVWLLHALPFALCVGVYTVLITIIARSETHASLDRRRWLAVAMPVIALAPALLIGPSAAEWKWVALAAAAVVIWLARAARHALAAEPRTPQAVMTWLSGLCLIDAYFLTLLGQPHAALVAVGCFILTTLAHRRIAGT